MRSRAGRSTVARIRGERNPIALAMRVATVLRRAAKPLHPRGVVVGGTLDRDGGHPASGVAWLDEPGRDTVLVRCSRSAGLPRPLPDVYGLAIRVTTADGPADILLSSAPLGRFGRFLPTLRTRADAGPYSSVMPYRGPRGPLLIGAKPVARGAFALLWATPMSRWVRFGTLTVPEGTSDADVSFDPIAHPAPGLGTYGWTRRLREPAYRAARDQSGRSL